MHFLSDLAPEPKILDEITVRNSRQSAFLQWNLLRRDRWPEPAFSASHPDSRAPNAIWFRYGNRMVPVWLLAIRALCGWGILVRNAQLVPVEVTHIGGEAWAARTGRALASATEVEGQGMQPRNLLTIPDAEADHRAVPHGCGLPSKGFATAKAKPSPSQ